MRALILGDIHSNLEAFQAVLEDARAAGGWDEVWCLGDIVGYGPDPGPCLALLRGQPHRAVAGNHDWAAVGKLSLDDFNPYAAAAARWTARQLSADDRAYLAALPQVLEHDRFTLVHGSLRHPIWEYLLSAQEALPTFARLRTQVCLVGHSHIPFLCREVGPQACAFTTLPEGVEVRLGTERWIVNPGGVGQPRDGDPRAAYLLYDGERETLRFRRVPYDIPTTQAKMRRAALPAPLIERLQDGR